MNEEEYEKELNAQEVCSHTDTGSRYLQLILTSLHFQEAERLRLQRIAMLEKSAQKLRERSAAIKTLDKPLTEEDLYKREADMGMAEDEEAFNTEEPLEQK